MNLRVFLLNESKHLEPSSQTTFFESFQDGKSYYWIDVENPDPASQLFVRTNVTVLPPYKP